ncbi:MAG: cell wall-binding repeat-containing protein [Acidimicrobiales bacterium]|nr:cell wall-binding repeat-containing protein [Acidimicrobiales bacterium]
MKRIRKLCCVIVVFLVATAIGNISASATVNEAGPVKPHHWPSSEGLSPQLEAWPNAIRFHGPTRYQTGLAASLALRGNGGFPYTTPDPTSDDAQELATASGWWGANRCPRAVIVVAGDSPADALTATSLSDATGQSSEPYLQRSAAADPLFDPIGGFKRVDTDYAPVVVTEAARQGATALTLASRFALQDLRTGGCVTAREAIIVGGVAAVPAGVEDELISIGYTSVYRVSGANRFATASAVANSIGTAPIPAGVMGCGDTSVLDGSARMNFYANSVVEWRPSPGECQLLGRSVVLTDGITGADALAAGWWTSFWQVPVLLHDGSDELPPDTMATLQTLNVANILVLGGTSRISDSVANAAADLAGATIRRVSGANRYSTSVAMAKYLGGWWPTGSGTSSASSMICLAASSGSGVSAKGWADALGAGAWCATASGAAGNVAAPTRRLAPLTGNVPTTAVVPSRPARDAIPIILVPAGRPNLPVAVTSFLRENFPPTNPWCSSITSQTNCTTPGFVVVFGGSAVVDPTLVAAVSSAVGGDIQGAGVVSNPSLGDLYATQLVQNPVFHQSADNTLRLCILRGGYPGARWLVAGVDDDPKVRSVVDVMSLGWHLMDADGVGRTLETSTPGCLSLPMVAENNIWIRAVGLDGRSSPARYIAADTASRLSFTGPIVAFPPIASSGLDSSNDPVSGGRTSWTFSSVFPPVSASFGTESASLSASSIEVTLERGVEGVLPTPDTFSASWTIEGSLGTTMGSASGEAVRVAGSWELRGKASISGGSWAIPPGDGGFSATINVNSAGLSDDSINWVFDRVG